YKPNLVSSRISLAKNNLLLPEIYATRNHLLDEDREMRCPQIYQIYDKYMKRCRANGAMDFDDILLYMNILLRDHLELATQYSERFKYILVDEYQDTNFSQYLILKRLASSHGNICVVGDDSQSIYSFRGARIENILKFQTDYPSAQIVKLEQNYRSTSTIVNAANSLIDHNEHRLPKKLFSEMGQGDPIRVLCHGSDREEAARIAGDIGRTMRLEDAQPQHFAILYRTNAQSRALEEALRSKAIAYKIYGGQSFYQRAEVKDMLAYLRLAVNGRDDEALRRIINFPARGIGETSLAKIAMSASERGCSMFDIIRTTAPADMGIRGVAVKALQSFVDIFSTIGERINQTDAYEFAMELSNRSGIIQHFKNSRLIEDIARGENVEELLNSIKTFVTTEREEPQGVSITDWLSEVSLMTEIDPQSKEELDAVTMLTVHSSKGLEFRYTYIVGLEENLFPSLRQGDDQEIEEERRLFYVALTRGERRVTLSYATSRFRWGEYVDCAPSRFIKEIDKEYLDVEESESPQPRFSSTNNSPKFSQQPKTMLQKTALEVPTEQTPSETVESSGELKVGAVVRHIRFGRGRVTALERVAKDIRVTVLFETVGEKTLLEKFARLVVM
ncbi:MAG: 3'-5' exonuclease, partial [Mucinivorans sp.]